MPSDREFIFGYGSLAAAMEGSVGRLPGYRRVLGVAMDNRVDLPGYKFYRRRDGSRPAVYVAFADLVPDASGPPVNGTCAGVDAAGLAALDVRERNYDRVEVTAALEAPPGRTWAYLGSAAGRARLAHAVSTGSAVAARSYLALVEAGFRALGPPELAAFQASTSFGELPIEDLERVDL